jgi:glyoxylase-like metal-dependent hydrolase (beta-lactamase superfamily II)
MTATVIRNGRIVTAVDDYTADILMEEGRVRMIGTDLPVGEAVAEHDAAGLLVMPGGVDVHTHLDWDFGPARTADTFYTGSQAAAFGVASFELPPPDHDLVPGVNVSFGGSEFEVIFAPGHAPGHVIFVSTTEPVAIVGDVIFFGSIGRTDLPGGDYQVLMDSIRTRVLTLPPETRLITGHGPETTVAHERDTNPFLVPVYGGEFV